jgi:hypothetical protein
VGGGRIVPRVLVCIEKLGGGGILLQILGTLLQDININFAIVNN